MESQKHFCQSVINSPKISKYQQKKLYVCHIIQLLYNFSSGNTAIPKTFYKMVNISSSFVTKYDIYSLHTYTYSFICSSHGKK